MTKRPFRSVPGAAVSRWGPGEEAHGFEPGDFILTHNDLMISRLIRLGQRLRIRGDDRVFTHWSHAALIATGDGDLVDVNRRGVIRAHLSDYRDIEYHVVHTGADRHDREQVVEFGEWCVDHHQRIGVALFASMAVNVITGGKVDFFVDGTTVCSGMVARAQERCGVVFDRAPTHIMPADLAKYYDARPDGGGRRAASPAR